MVRGSTTSALATVFGTSVKDCVGPTAFSVRHRLYSTSLAVNGVPSWNFVSRRWNTQVNGSFTSHDAARSGPMTPRGSVRGSALNTSRARALLGVTAWKCGSAEEAAAAQATVMSAARAGARAVAASSSAAEPAARIVRMVCSFMTGPSRVGSPTDGAPANRHAASS